ncbi:oligosaccharide flippase family protein [Novosphingobium sp. KCTC 2891]|uniref:oligosaccharide flippase family protein n=1 Tax=Novosphingobium sp. KCTC 2891 TaxID=2989730 RepID=UPI0022232BEB|nr:oligosaccharide flippase family protein [Novosphingobium sp. KCTC 2891]MCW1383270.1 oligosaccharide flippase family protein [Novosphingobium sp. KCTC 2891]
MLNIRRNVIFSLIEVCSSTVLTFFSYRTVVDLGGIALLGIWSTLFAWLGLSRLGDFGLGGASTRFIAPLDARVDRDRIAAYIDTAIISNFILITGLSLISAFVVSHWLTFVVGAEHLAAARPVLPWMVAAIIATNLCMVINSSLFGLHRGFVRSTIMVGGNLIQLGCVFWLVPRYGLVGFAMAQLIQYGLGSVAAWIAVCSALGGFRLPLAFRWTTLREMLGISMKLQLANILNSAFEPLSKMLVSHFGGMHMQGLYESAFRGVSIARNLFSNTSTSMIPAMARLIHTDPPEARKLYRVTGRHVLRGTPLIFGGLVLAAPVISVLWFRSFEPSFWIFVALLSFGHATAAWCAPAYNLGQATGNMRGVILSTATGLVLLAAGGTALGLLGRPNLIVAMVSAALVVQNLIVRRLNEPMIGLGRGHARLAEVAA